MAEYIDCKQTDAENSNNSTDARQVAYDVTKEANAREANAREANAKDIADGIAKAFQYVARPRLFSEATEITVKHHRNDVTPADVLEDKILTFLPGSTKLSVVLKNEIKPNHRLLTTSIVNKFIWDSFIEQINLNFAPSRIKNLSSSGNKKQLPMFYLWLHYRDTLQNDLMIIGFDEAQDNLKRYIKPLKSNISRIKSKISSIDQGKLTLAKAQKYEIWEGFIRSKFNTLLPVGTEEERVEVIKNLEEQISEIDAEIHKFQQVLNSFVNAQEILQKTELRGKAWITRKLSSAIRTEYDDLWYGRQLLENKKQTLEGKLTEVRMQESGVSEEQTVINNFRKFLQDKLELEEIHLKCAEQDLNRVTNIVKFVRKQVKKLNYIVPCPYNIVYQ